MTLYASNYYMYLVLFIPDERLAPLAEKERFRSSCLP